MPVFGEKFVYLQKQFTEAELRVANTKSAYAKLGRQKARKFAEAKKRAQQTHKEGDDVLPSPPEKDLVARTRSAYAKLGRQKARKFAEAKKRAQQTHKEDNILPSPPQKEIVTLTKDNDTVVEVYREADQQQVLPVKEEEKELAVKEEEPMLSGDEDSEVRRSLYSPALFLDHLAKQEEFFLHYLRGHYGVAVFVDPPKRRVHIKGPKTSVLTCYSGLKDLLKGWHTRDSAQD